MSIERGGGMAENEREVGEYDREAWERLKREKKPVFVIDEARKTGVPEDVVQQFGHEVAAAKEKRRGRCRVSFHALQDLLRALALGRPRDLVRRLVRAVRGYRPPPLGRRELRVVARDDAVVDPSPYGSLGSLTGNAPTVRSAQLPAEMQPSQGRCTGGAAWMWATQTASGVVAARCNYAGTYQFHEAASDVPEALRDFVLLPSADGTAATLVVVDRALTGGKDRDLYLRFRTPGKLALAGDRATATVGGTRLSIAGLGRTSGTPSLGGATMKDCEHDTTRGTCEAARFPITDYRVQLAGPRPRAAHALSVTDERWRRRGRDVADSSGTGWAGVRVGGTRDAVAALTDADAKELAYSAPRAARVTHVVLDAPEIDDCATVTGKPVGDTCAVDVVGGGSAALAARPLVITLDGNCAVALDCAGASAPSAANPKPARAAAHAPRNGCCDAGAPAGGPLVLALLVLGATRRGRARCAR